MNLRYTIQILSIFTLSACSTASYTSYNIEQLRPAYYTLPSTVEKILVVNCAEQGEVSDILISNKRSDQTAYLRRIPDMACAVLSAEINSSDFKHASTENRHWNFERMLQKSDSLCSANEADLILALRDYDYKSKLEGGKYPSEGMICVSLLGIMRSQFVLVTPSGISSELEERNDTLEWSFCDTSEEAVIQRLPQYNEVYFHTAENVGEECAKQLTPTWQTVNRYMLSSDARKMQDAVRWAYNENWDNARDLWVENFKVAVGADKARTAYNIALYYEHEGDIDEASIWCSKALDLYHLKPGKKMKSELELAQNLFDSLVKRQEECKILDKQMGR